MNQQQASFKWLFLYLLTTLGQKKSVYLLAFVFGLGNTALMLLTPLVYEVYFNALELRELEMIELLMKASAGCIFLLIGLHLLGTYLKQNVVTGVARKIMLQTLSKVNTMPYDRSQRYHSGDLFQRVTHDATNTGFIVKSMDDFGGQVIALVVAAAYMLYINQLLAFVILLLMPIALSGSTVLRKQLQRIGQQVSDQNARVRQIIQEMLQGMEIIRAYMAESWFVARYIKEKRTLNRLQMKQMWLSVAVEIVSSTLSMLLVWAAVVYIAWLTIEGEMQVGELMAFFILIWRIYNPMHQLGVIWGAVQQGVGASNRIFKLNAELADNVSEAVDRQACEYEVHLDNVSYSYTSADGAVKPSIRNVDLTILQGEFVALVGRSGSGKSTLAKLMAGLYMPSYGEIVVRGGASGHIVTYVSQQAYLFSGTIRENFQLIHTDATEEEITEVLKITQAYRWVRSLPQGLDTEIQEGGQSLSGGQKQRLVLARALLSKRSVLIMDEATSALDAAMEQEVLKAVFDWVQTKNITLVIIAHHLASIQGASKIVVLNEGQIAESGSHSQLYANKSIYYTLLIEGGANG